MLVVALFNFVGYKLQQHKVALGFDIVQLEMLQPSNKDDWRTIYGK